MVDQHSRKHISKANQNRIPWAYRQHEREEQPRGGIPDCGTKLRNYDDFWPVEQKEKQHKRKRQKSMADDESLFMHGRSQIRSLPVLPRERVRRLGHSMGTNYFPAAARSPHFVRRGIKA